MGRVACLLRAVNVAGTNKVPMAALRQALGEAGLDSVSTYIQSGNVAFDQGDRSTHQCEQLVESVLVDRFDVRNAAAFVRTREQIAKVIADEPWGLDPVTDDGKAALYVCFVRPALAPDIEVDTEAIAPDRLALFGTHAYLRYSSGAGQSKLTTAKIEKMLGITATARNWKTMTKLVDLVA